MKSVDEIIQEFRDKKDLIRSSIRDLENEEKRLFGKMLDDLKERQNIIPNASYFRGQQHRSLD